jgi:[ribosomal protein S18]-alanine N-acetyltransferase
VGLSRSPRPPPPPWVIVRPPMRSVHSTSAVLTRNWRGMLERSDNQARYWIDRLEGERDLDGVLSVEAESFTNPWTREMYAWELQNRSVCHIYVARTPDCEVAGFCAFWLVFDEIHINNVAMRPRFRGHGIGTGLMRHVLAEATRLGARRATLEVRASNEGARRLYERLGFYVAATRRNYYTNPVEDALILWRDDVPTNPSAASA